MLVEYEEFVCNVVENRWASSVNKWWIWLIVVVGGIIITFLCFLCHAKLKKHRKEGNQCSILITKNQAATKLKYLYFAFMLIRGEKKQTKDAHNRNWSQCINAIPSAVHDKVKNQSKDKLVMSCKSSASKALLLLQVISKPKIN